MSDHTPSRSRDPQLAGPPEAADVEPAEVATEALHDRIALGGRSLREHTARGAIINSLFQVGFAGLSLLQKVAVAAFLTASEFGLWGIVVTTLMTLAFLKQVGISEKYVQQAEGDQVLAFQKAFTLHLAYTLCFYVVVAAALPLYVVIYGRPEILVPGLVASLVLLGGALQTPIWIAYRQMRFVRQRSLEAVSPVVSTAVMVPLAASGFGYWSLIIGIVAGSFAGAAVAIGTCPYPLAWRFDREALREYFQFSWPLLATSASGLVVIQGSIIVGNYTVGLAGLGALALASNFSMFADKVDTIIRRTIYPAVCAVRERTDLLFEVFTKSNRVALMWAMPFGAGMALFAPDLVEFVLGDRWREAGPLLQAFGLIIAFRQVAFNWVAFFSAVGNTRPMAVNGAAQVAVFATVTGPLMIWLGLAGYAIGMAAAVAVELALRGYYLSRLFTGFRIFRHALRAIAPSLPAVALILGFRLLSGAERTLELALAELAAYMLATAVATYVLERRLVREMWGYLRRLTRPAGAGAGEVATG